MPQSPAEIQIVEQEPNGDPEPGLEEQDEKGPLRRCIASGLSGPKETLVRFVIGPDGVVHPDVDGRLPGRGIWLSARRDVVNTAVTKSLFAKAARRKVGIPSNLAESVGHLLARRCLDLLSLARRAGQAVTGYEKVVAEIKGGRVAVLLEAQDAGEHGIGKIKALARGVPVTEYFSAPELGSAFGRDHAVHVAVAPGGLAERLIVEMSRLSGFRRNGEESLVTDEPAARPANGKGK